VVFSGKLTRALLYRNHQGAYTRKHALRASEQLATHPAVPYNGSRLLAGAGRSADMTARTAWRVGWILVFISLSCLGGAERAGAQAEPVVLVYGQTVEGEISPNAPSRSYAFDAQANDVVTITMIATGGALDPFITLTDAQGVQLTTDDDSGGQNNARLAFVIPMAGRYRIQASDAGGLLTTVSGTYSLSVSAVGEGGIIVERAPLPEPTPTPNAVVPAGVPGDQQGQSTRLLPIAPGAGQPGELTRQVAFRLYWFRVETGAEITIAATGADDFAPGLTLFDAGFEAIQRGEPGEPLSAWLDAAGVYFAGVSLPEAGSTGGSYTLALDIAGVTGAAAPDASEPPALPQDFAGLPAIAPGDTLEGTLDNEHFMDIYAFPGEAGQRVIIEMNSLNPETLNGLDPFLLLLDDARIPLEEDDDIVDGVERDAQIEYTLPRTAYYAIVATRYDREAGTSIGPYELSLSAASSSGDALLLPDSAPLQPNAPVQAVFDGSPDAYTFEAQAGELIDLSITADPGLDPVLILATGTLREIVSSGTGALTALRTPAAGTYYLIVTTRFGPVGGTGGYILAFNQPDRAAALAAGGSGEALTSPAETETIALGQTLSGIIDDATPSRVYTLNGTAEQRVRLTLRAAPGSDLDPYLELRDVAGTVIDANDDIDPGVIRDAQIVITLPQDGAYQLLVSRYVGPDAAPTSGAYELTIEPAEAGEAAPAAANAIVTPISYGQTQAGAIDNDHYLLFYVFTGAAGDVVTVEVDQLSGNVDAILHLYQATGGSWTQIAYNDDSPIGGTYDPRLSDVTLPASGTYLIAIGRYGLDKEVNMAGTFSITLTRQP